jgi:NodT family efflux transporter outer membrane factor (OMF) lipoprotein
MVSALPTSYMTQAAGLAAAAMLLGACAVGPDFVRPKAPDIRQYTQGTEPVATVQAEGMAQSFAPGAKIAADWWQLFNSPQLDAAIKQAIADNPSLQAAQASLRESQDNLRAGYGVFFPQLSVAYDPSRQLFSPLKLGQNGAGSIFNLFTLSATVSYAIDAFGGARRGLEGLQAQTDYQRFETALTYLTLSGNVVNTVIARAGYAEQIDATVRLIDILREQVSITEAQYRAGTVPYSTVLSVHSQLWSTEATIPPLRQKFDQAGHLLATLEGKAPAAWTPPLLVLDDLTLPGTLPLSLPSELVRQRPDILAAESTLHNASAGIGVATAALFPSFTLSGSYGYNSLTQGNIGANNGKFWSIGGDILAPIFDGGTLRYKRQAAIEAYRQSEAMYRQSVLGGLQQVADTLRGLEHDAETLRAQTDALAGAEEALRLIGINYRAGTVNYLAVLTADTQYFQTKIGFLQARAQRLQDTAALFVALGGGWWDNAANILGADPPDRHASSTLEKPSDADSAKGRRP